MRISDWSSDVCSSDLTPTGVENIVGTSYGDWLYGSAGANKLYGEDGNDRLVGGAGNDMLDGGTGDDVAYYSGLKDDYRIDIAEGTAIGRVHALTPVTNAPLVFPLLLDKKTKITTNTRKR